MESTKTEPEVCPRCGHPPTRPVDVVVDEDGVRWVVRKCLCGRLSDTVIDDRDGFLRLHD